MKTGKSMSSISKAVSFEKINPQNIVTHLLRLTLALGCQANKVQ